MSSFNGFTTAPDTALFQVRITAQENATVNASAISINTTIPQFSNPIFDYNSIYTTPTFVPSTAVGSTAPGAVTNVKYERLAFSSQNYTQVTQLCGNGFYLLVPDDNRIASLQGSVLVWDNGVQLGLVNPIPSTSQPSFPCMGMSAGGAFAVIGTTAVPTTAKTLTISVVGTVNATPTAPNVTFNMSLLLW